MGVQVDHQESKDNTSRTLVIPVESRDSEIQIIGTHVVPEFGAMVFLVLFTTLTIGIVTSKIKLIQ